MTSKAFTRAITTGPDLSAYATTSALSDALATKANASDLSTKANASDLATVVPSGTIAHFALSAAPTGWLKANGTTIGSASSGATRANADTQALFTALWAATSLAIQTSAGAAATRGASAAADFTANKRLVLPDLRGEFVRGLADGRTVDASRALLSAQAEAIGPHTHPMSSSGADRTLQPDGNTQVVASQQYGGTVPTGANDGTENRPRNVAALACIKL